MQYRMLSVAAEDLAAAVSYYEEQSSGLGDRFLDEFEATVQRILHHPEAWQAVSANQRRCLFRRFPFALLYAREGAGILVTAVVDLRTEPDKQRERIRKT